MSEPHPLDDPVKRGRVVRQLVFLSPLLFAFSYWLAWIQDAEPRHCLIIAGVALAMCLGAALAIRLMGSKSWMALVAVKIALLLVGRR